ncbi:hypothetical protein TNCV_2202591 [Trichonephila clavipes]|uniref:Uncharacterized protein n=1 Tax=Trichonephila clavipes TaxID=2585209 RepID=A0A8X6UZ70_TRICX|nr:hypothetical protein TNCV_2202591 [Trichonephila clavipes]
MKRYDQKAYKLPPPTPAHVPAETNKRPFEEQPFLQNTQIPDPPVQIPVTPELTTSQPPVQILLPDPSVELKPVVETLEPTLTDESSMDQIMSSVFGDCSQQGIQAPQPIPKNPRCLTRCLPYCSRVADMYVKWLTWLDDWEMHRDDNVSWRMVGLQPWKRALEKHVHRSHEKALVNGMPSDVTLLEHILGEQPAARIILLFSD